MRALSIRSALIAFKKRPAALLRAVLLAFGDGREGVGREAVTAAIFRLKTRAR